MRQRSPYISVYEIKPGLVLDDRNAVWERTRDCPVETMCVLCGHMIKPHEIHWYLAAEPELWRTMHAHLFCVRVHTPPRGFFRWLAGWVRDLWRATVTVLGS